MYCEYKEGHGRCFTPISAAKRCPKRGHHADAGGQGGIKTNLITGVCTRSSPSLFIETEITWKYINTIQNRQQNLK